MAVKMKGSRHLTIVVKIGTSSIVDEVTHEPILPILSSIVDAAIKLKRDGHRVIIVSSGAIGVGLQRMNIDKKPKHLPQKQALAAIGQCRLIAIWDSLFAHMRQPVAQILLTRNDIHDRSQYLNAQNTLHEVLNYGVIPIVNENDTLAVSEIKFGDNDTLSAITAAMVHADYLFLMTDVEALYDKNPRLYNDAKPIKVVEDIDELDADVSSKGSSLGTGGMATKIIAARLATSAGTTTIITTSSKPGNITDIVRHFHPNEPQSAASSTQTTPNSSNGTVSSNGSTKEPPLHTRFLPSAVPMRNRAFWILHGLSPKGTIYIDRGASAALHDKAGLLPVGVVDVRGTFAQQEAVRIVVIDKGPAPSLPPTPGATNGSFPSITPTVSNTDDEDYDEIYHRPNTPTLHAPFSRTLKGEEIGRAVVNYSADQILRIKGLRSSEISKVLGYADSEYVAFRENVSLNLSEAQKIRSCSRPSTPTNANTNERRLSRQISYVNGENTPTGTGSPNTTTTRPRSGSDLHLTKSTSSGSSSPHLSSPLVHPKPIRPDSGNLTGMVAARLLEKSISNGDTNHNKNNNSNNNNGNGSAYTSTEIKSVNSPKIEPLGGITPMGHSRGTSPVNNEVPEFEIDAE